MLFRRYVFHFVFRVTIFLAVFFTYLLHKEFLMRVFEFRLFDPVSPMHILWLIFMGEMILQALPGSPVSMGCLKQHLQNYHPVPGYDSLSLSRHVQAMNLSAMKVLLVWLSANAVFGILYLFGIIGAAELVMLTLLYYIGDLVCVVFFCPFQTFFMKNKCCVTCRIFSWAHFMMYTPMLFIRSFFSWSLFFASIALLIRWEAAYLRHPERFWENSNARLQCKHCADKMCVIKKPLRRAKEPILYNLKAKL